MNETIAKAILGNMLRRSRIDSGHSQREVAAELGLPNPNYLSMIEKGTNFIPVKRLWDFVDAFRLNKFQGLAVVKLCNEDMWKTICKGLLAGGLTSKQVTKLADEVNSTIKEEGIAAGVELISID